MIASVKRWTPARKEELLARIRSGELARDQAMTQHQLSAEELEAWEAGFARDGRRALRVGGARPRGLYRLPA